MIFQLFLQISLVSGWNFQFTTAFAFYFAKSKFTKPMFIFASIMAFTRLYLYVHYPTDILGGIVCGLISAYLGYKLIIFFENHLKNINLKVKYRSRTLKCVYRWHIKAQAKPTFVGLARFLFIIQLILPSFHRIVYYTLDWVQIFS